MHRHRGPARQAAIEKRRAAARATIGSSYPRGLQASRAQRDQRDVIAGDFTLTEQARLRHPAVRWWWGDRNIEGVHGALCYLCDEFIVTWDSRWPVTRAAELAILDHRDQVHASG